MTHLLATPARAVRPSIPAAYQWERRKGRSPWYWPTIIALAVAGQALGYSQYVTYLDEFRQQNLTWAALWAQSMLLPTMLFFPLAIGAWVTQTATAEHDGGNWQRMAASRLAGTMVAGKVAAIGRIAVLTTLVAVGTFVATGLLLGFDPQGLSPYLLRIIPITVAIWATGMFVAWLGVVLRSFAGIMTATLGATLLGLALCVAAPEVAGLYPMAQITAATAARTIEDVASAASIAMAALVAAAWRMLWSMALRIRVGRVS